MVCIQLVLTQANVRERAVIIHQFDILRTLLLLFIFLIFILLVSTNGCSRALSLSFSVSALTDHTIKTIKHNFFVHSFYTLNKRTYNFHYLI